MNYKRGVIFVALVMVLSGTGAAVAGAETAGDSVGGMGTKFVRGLGNVLTSPAEIPCTIGSEMSVRPNVGFFTGLGKGTAFMLRRILVGVCEVGTFMMPAEATLPPVCSKAK